MLQCDSESSKWIESSAANIAQNINAPVESLKFLVKTFFDKLDTVCPADAKFGVYSLYLAIVRCENQVLCKGRDALNLEQYLTSVSKIKTLDEAKIIFHEIVAQIDNATSDDGSQYPDVVDRIIKYIDSNINNTELCRTLIASDLGLSKSYVSRVFNDVIGITLPDYVNDLRMKNVAKALVLTDKSINEIAESCGYMNYMYFSSLFKKKYGVTPSDYRHNNTKMNRE